MKTTKDLLDIALGYLQKIKKQKYLGISAEEEALRLRSLATQGLQEIQQEFNKMHIELDREESAEPIEPAEQIERIEPVEQIEPTVSAKKAKKKK